jgi:FAD/FMN-containing dehydrogenase/Fe-S oxidoreductase
MSSKQFLEDPAVNFVDFLNVLDDVGFEGEISPHQADRIIASTDNSVYQLLPQGVLYPKHETDLQAIFKLAAQSRFKSIYFAPRGGGTGTNGQSLTDGLIVDCSRHLNAIVDVDIEAGWVKVQAGVIRDQLNDFLRPHGVFFAPTLSTSNRATLGGMASTDACGQGSRIYGRTSNHVLALNLVLASGQQVISHALTPQALQEVINKGDALGQIYSQVSQLIADKQQLIDARFPNLNRFMTGYNLAHVQTDNGFDLSRLICGSEGTLAVVSELTLKLTPLPKFKQLLVLRYGSFDAALRDANQLVQQNPDAIETIDSTILQLAQGDVIWHRVKDYIAFDAETDIAAINLVEFSAMDATALTAKVDAVCSVLNESGARYYRVVTEQAMASMWELRKKGVGLLGNLQGLRRPIAFVEDTAVPPEHLADYIVEFRRLLDDIGVTYGMFGHVDAGCLHVRPALNMRDPQDAKKLRIISDAVQALVQKYQGVMWGEHGKGFRSEYTQATIGTELYADMRRIKGWFDPLNQLNPGKICSPLDSDVALVQVDDPRTRGAADSDIDETVVEQWQPVVACNGNGACFNYQPQAAMCPSYKATKDRVQSPKGRASLLREWLRQEATGGADPALETQVYQSLQSCLACKACTTACPVKVDIPTYRSRFLQRYFAKRRRPLSDYVVALVEPLAMVTSKASRLSNWGMQLGASRWLIKNLFGMVNLPKIHSYKLSNLTAIDGVEAWHPHKFESLPNAQKRRSVVIVQDVFSSCYDLPQVQGILSCLVKMGFTPIVLPLKASAKPLYVKGFLTAFEKQAAAVAQHLQQVQQQGLTLVAVDPSVGLTFGDEYRQILGPEAVPDVLLLQQWLHQVEGLINLPTVSVAPDMAPTLLGHCSETALVVQGTAQWVGLFAKFGIALNTPATGCCGMAGTFGHEQKHQILSAKLYAMSWQQPVNAAQGAVLATGYSCRSQIALRSDQQPLHPLNYLNRCLEEAQGSALN